MQKLSLAATHSAQLQPDYVVLADKEAARTFSPILSNVYFVPVCIRFWVARVNQATKTQVLCLITGQRRASEDI